MLRLSFKQLNKKGWYDEIFFLFFILTCFVLRWKKLMQKIMNIHNSKLKILGKIARIKVTYIFTIYIIAYIHDDLHHKTWFYI